MKYPLLKSYPKTLRIGDEDYRIRFVSLIPGEDEKTLGMCDSGLKLIYIKRGQGREEAFKTLIHECLHGFEFEYNIKIKHRLIHDLEPIIALFLLDNF